MNKNILFVLLTGMLLTFTGPTSEAAVCTPGFVYPYTSCSWGMSVGSFSVAGYAGAIADTSSCSGSGYEDLYGSDSVVLQQTINYSLGLGIVSTSTYMDAEIWIDFNNNDVFESTESVGGANNILSSGSIILVIPYAAPLGFHRMRILVKDNYYSGSYPGTDPCASGYNYGDVRDYKVRIVSFAPCTGTPYAGVCSTTLTGPACPSTPFSLTDAGATHGYGISWQWQSSADSTTWTNIAGATDSVWSQSETDTTFFRCKVTCAGSSLSDYSNALKIPYAHLCYCYPSFGDPWRSCSIFNYSISQFTVFGSSGTAILDSSSCSGSGYEDKTNLSCNFQAGSHYSLYVLCNYFYSGSSYSLNNQVWIDFNDNGIFEMSETVGGADGYATNITETLFIPSGSLPGSHRMRISQFGSGSGIGWPYSDPCPSGSASWAYQYGDVRDYTVIITGSTAYLTPSNLTFGCASVGSCASPMAFNISDRYLTPATGNVTVTAPSGFKVSSSAGGTYSTSYTISYTGAAVNQMVYVTFCPASTVAYTGRVVLTGGGIDTSTFVTVTGSGCSSTCSGAPVAGTVNATASAACSSFSTLLSLAGASAGTGINYQWQSSPDSATWTNISGATLNVYPATITSSIFYRCKVTCSASGASSYTWSYFFHIGGPAIYPVSGPTSVCIGYYVTLTDATLGGAWSSSNLAIATVDGYGNVFGVAAGNVVISYAVLSSGGCYSYATYTVNCGNTSTLTGSIAPANASLCHLSSVTLVANSTYSGLNYQWYRNGTLIPGATNGSLTATSGGNYAAVIANSCGLDTLAGSLVTAAPSPSIHLTGGHTLYTGSFSSYQWYLNGVAIPGAVSSTYNYTLPGIYTVRVSDASGCSVTSGGYAASGGVNGVTAILAVDDIKVYPNPNAGIFSVELPAVFPGTTITISDITGRVIKSSVAGLLLNQIDLMSVPAGIYFVKVTVNGVAFNKKVVKE